MVNIEEITLNQLIAVWWSFLWRATIFGALLGLVLGFVGGMVLAVAGHREAAPAIGGLMGYLGGLLASFFALRSALQNKYKSFTIVLSPQNNPT